MEEVSKEGESREGSGTGMAGGMGLVDNKQCLLQSLFVCSIDSKFQMGHGLLGEEHIRSVILIKRQPVWINKMWYNENASWQ